MTVLRRGILFLVISLLALVMKKKVIQIMRVIMVKMITVTMT